MRLFPSQIQQQLSVRHTNFHWQILTWRKSSNNFQKNSIKWIVPFGKLMGSLILLSRWTRHNTATAASMLTQMLTKFEQLSLKTIKNVAWYSILRKSHGLIPKYDSIINVECLLDADWGMELANISSRNVPLDTLNKVHLIWTSRIHSSTVASLTEEESNDLQHALGYV